MGREFHTGNWYQPSNDLGLDEMPSDSSGFQAMVHYGDNSENGANMGFLINNGKPFIHGHYRDWAIDFNVCDNQWNMLTFVYEATATETGEFYFNGELKSTNPSLVLETVPSTIVHVGYDPNAAIFEFHEDLDDIKIWNSALTSLEVQQLYNHSLVESDSLATCYLPQENAAVTALLMVIPPSTGSCASVLHQLLRPEASGGPNECTVACQSGFAPKEDEKNAAMKYSCTIQFTLTPPPVCYPLCADSPVSTTSTTYPTQSLPSNAGKIVAGSCASGYSGTAGSATCSTEGTWSYTTSTCAASCSEFPVTGVRFNIPGDAPFPVPSGTVANGTCESGYTGTGGQRTCNNGDWDVNEASNCALMPSASFLSAALSTPLSIITSGLGYTSNHYLQQPVLVPFKSSDISINSHISIPSTTDGVITFTMPGVYRLDANIRFIDDAEIPVAGAAAWYLKDAVTPIGSTQPNSGLTATSSIESRKGDFSSISLLYEIDASSVPVSVQLKVISISERAATVAPGSMITIVKIAP